MVALTDIQYRNIIQTLLRGFGVLFYSGVPVNASQRSGAVRFTDYGGGTMPSLLKNIEFV